MNKLFAPLCLALAALLPGGCTSNVAISTAGLAVDLVRLQPSGNGELRATWRMRNPNIVAYVFTRSTHKVRLNGTEVGTLTDTRRVGVPSQNQIELTGTLTTTGPAARTVMDQAVATGSADYRMESTLWLLLVQDKTEKLEFTSSGTVPVVRE